MIEPVHVGSEPFLDLGQAADYMGYKGKSSLQDFLKRLNIQKWQIPLGSRKRYVKQSDLDQALTPVPVTRKPLAR
jgi:hypothetical protein